MHHRRPFHHSPLHLKSGLMLYHRRLLLSASKNGQINRIGRLSLTLTLNHPGFVGRQQINEKENLVIHHPGRFLVYFLHFTAASRENQCGHLWSLVLPQNHSPSLSFSRRLHLFKPLLFLKFLLFRCVDQSLPNVQSTHAVMPQCPLEDGLRLCRKTNGNKRHEERRQTRRSEGSGCCHPPGLMTGWW